MLRRLIVLVLAITCAFAPASWAFELTAASAADPCCCGTKCPCPPTDCAPPPASPSTASPASASAAAHRSLAAKPRARLATALFARFISAPAAEPALTVRIRASHADGLAPAASVALYQAHCSFLL